MRYQLFSPELVPGGPAVTIRLYEKLPPMRFAGGGLAQAAEAVRAHGRGGDEILIHINPEEYKFLQKKWGEPSINPTTGLPEYGLFSKIKKGLKKAWKSVKKVVKKAAPFAGIIASVFMPALAPAIGAAMGASGVAATALGNAVISGASGAITGGGKGALAGALTGGLSPYAGKIGGGALGKIAPSLAKSGAVNDIVGKALIGGAGSKIQGGDFSSGAIQSGVLAALSPRPGQPQTPSAASAQTAGASAAPPASGGMLQDIGMPDLEATTAGASSVNIPQPGILSRALGSITDYAKANPLQAGIGALGVVNALSSGRGGEEGEGGPPPELPPGFNDPLPQLEFNRQRQAMDPDAYYTYGSGAEHSFFGNNVLPEKEKEKPTGTGLPKARGGGVLAQMASGGPSPAAAQQLVKGPGSGREDLIDAKLSDGEYVFDAETVALLGDGSTDEGARRLDQLREKIRKHKGRKLAKGKFSDDAKPPEEYLGV